MLAGNWLALSKSARVWRGGAVGLASASARTPQAMPCLRHRRIRKAGSDSFHWMLISRWG